MSLQHRDDEQERIYNHIITNIKILERFINTKCFFNLDKIERTIDELILLRKACQPRHCEEIDSRFLKIKTLLNKEQLERIFKKIFNYNSERVSNNNVSKKKMMNLFEKGGKSNRLNKQTKRRHQK